jgi:hypothetical protein
MNKVGVDEYIGKQVSPQREICEELRKMILDRYPDIGERMKLGVPWYGECFYIVSLRDHVNLGFSMKGLTKDEVKLFKGKGTTMRVVEISSLGDIDVGQIVKLMEIVMDRYVKDNTVNGHH